MATSIRLSRGGSKKRPYYRIVVADARSPRDGRFIERIGSYNPVLPKDHADRIKLDVERAKHWVSVGAQPTDRVARFLDALGIKERSPRNNPNKGTPGAKAKERAEDRASKAAEAAELAAAARESESHGSVKTPETAAAVADAVAGEVPTDATNADATAMAAEVSEGGPTADTNSATPDSDAGDAPSTAGEGESSQAPAEG